MDNVYLLKNLIGFGLYERVYINGLNLFSGCES